MTHGGRIRGMGEVVDPGKDVLNQPVLAIDAEGNPFHLLPGEVAESSFAENIFRRRILQIAVGESEQWLPVEHQLFEGSSQHDIENRSGGIVLEFAADGTGQAVVAIGLDLLDTTLAVDEECRSRGDAFQQLDRWQRFGFRRIFKAWKMGRKVRLRLSREG